MVHPVRVAVSGLTEGPGLFEMLALIGLAGGASLSGLAISSLGRMASATVTAITKNARATQRRLLPASPSSKDCTIPNCGPKYAMPANMNTPVISATRMTNRLRSGIAQRFS